MSLAVEVASRSNCLKSHVGAILLLGDRVRAVGWIQRLEKMKSDAYEYAKSKGVLKTG